MLVSTSTKSNSELIAAYLDAVMRKDATVVERFVAPHVEYMVNGAAVLDPEGVLPPSRRTAMPRFPGLASIAAGGGKEFLAHMHRNLEITAFGPREVISEGNKAAGFRMVPAACSTHGANLGHLLFDQVRIA
jgi:ketosteroid isomerase-like protein